MSRMSSLEAFYDIFKETGIYLLVKTSSGYNFPVAADDLGYVFYTTLFASSFNMSSLDAALFVFYGMCIVSFCIIGVSFLSLAATTLGYLLTLLFLVRLVMPIVSLNHVYIAYLLGVSPIVMLLLVDQKKQILSLKSVFFLAGLIAAIADNVRILSALPMIIFYGIWLLFVPHKKIKLKIFLTFLFVLGYMVPYGHYHYYIHQRNIFLKRRGVELPNDSQRHVFWHNIYTGLGFLSNQEGIVWSDPCAANRALKINPEAKYPSHLYEKTIRNEIFRLCREKRYFIVTTIFAKLGVILYFFLIYLGFFGVLVSLVCPKPWYMELAFWISLGVSALPGVLTIPVVPYLIGFISLTIIYSLYSCLYVLNYKLSQANEKG